MCWKDMFFSWCVGVVSWCRFNCFFFQTNASYMPKPKDKLVPLITVRNATSWGNSIFSEENEMNQRINKFISRQMRLENFHCFLVNVSHIPWINDLKNQGVFYRRDFVTITIVFSSLVCCCLCFSSISPNPCVTIPVSLGSRRSLLWHEVRLETVFRTWQTESLCSHLQYHGTLWRSGWFVFKGN